MKQESIPVGCIPPNCQQYVLQPPDASTSGRVWPQVNKFKQVSSDGHQISLEGVEPGLGVPCLMSGGCVLKWTNLNRYPVMASRCHQHGSGHPVSNVWGTLYSEAQWVLVTCRHPSPCGHTHTYENITFPQLGWRAVIKLLFTKLIWCRFKSNNKLSR